MLEEPDMCFNDKQDQDESDRDCGGAKCGRRCGSAQRCNRDRDCAANLKCRNVVVSRGANGTSTEEKRCSCPSGRYMSFKNAEPSCVRLQELCSNGYLDAAHESDVDW